MPSKRSIELTALSLDQLKVETTEQRSSLTKMKFEHAVKGLQNPKEIGNAKKEIARLNTEERSREISSMTPEQIAKRSML